MINHLINFSMSCCGHYVLFLLCSKLLLQDSCVSRGFIHNNPSDCPRTIHFRNDFCNFCLTQPNAPNNTNFIQRETSTGNNCHNQNFWFLYIFCIQNLTFLRILILAMTVVSFATDCRCLIWRSFMPSQWHNPHFNTKLTFNQGA